MFKKTQELLNTSIQQEYEEVERKEIEKRLNEETRVQIVARSSVLKQKVAHLFMSGRYTKTQVGEILNISPAYVSKILAMGDVQNLISETQGLEDELYKQEIKSLREIALKKQRELILHADDERVSADMIKDVLDRSGHKPVEKKEIAMSHSYEQNLSKLMEGVDFTVLDVEEANEAFMPTTQEKIRLGDDNMVINDG